MVVIKQYFENLTINTARIRNIKVKNIDNLMQRASSGHLTSVFSMVINCPKEILCDTGGMSVSKPPKMRYESGEQNDTLDHIHKNLQCSICSKFTY